MRHLFTYLVKVSIKRLIQFPVWVYYWGLYYFSERPAQRKSTVHTGTCQPTGLWCICAIYQPKRTSRNLATFLACMQEAGYNVIAVHNGVGAPDLPSVLGPFCHTVMTRSPGGRDLGSYREGTFYLNTLAERDAVRQVVYCNDSVFVKPSALQTLLTGLRDMTDDYIGVIESYERLYHVQSWFFALSGGAFHAAWHQMFWRDYIPTSHRGRSTVVAELGLSQLAMRNGVHPKVLYANKFIIDHLLPQTTTGSLHRLLTFASNSRAIPLYHNIREILLPPRQNTAPSALGGGPGALEIDGPLDQKALHFMLRRRLDTMSELTNPMALFNLFLLSSSDFPFIKKELVYKDLYFCVQVDRAIAHWSGVDAQELPEIKAFFRMRTALRWTVLRRAMVIAGIG